MRRHFIDEHGVIFARRVVTAAFPLRAKAGKTVLDPSIVIVPASAGSKTSRPPPACLRALGKSISASVDGLFPHAATLTISVTENTSLNHHLSCVLMQ